LYVIPTIEEFRQGKDRGIFYGFIERKFYAFWMKESPEMLDMWDSENRRTKYLLNYDYFDYYIINTMVGIGSKIDEETIKRIHIRFTIWPIMKKYMLPEIISIYPSYVSKTVGEVSIKRNTESQIGYGIRGNAGGGVNLSNAQGKLDAFIKLFKKNIQ
jgi:hypothetical protein